MAQEAMVGFRNRAAARRVAHVELESASRVQTRLLPRRGPRLATLEYAALSCPALGVGGDYYDFVPIAPRRVALTLGDVSGKGVSAALLMAALQASLRSHYALGAGSLADRLRSVNRLFREWTASGDFVTLFVGEYDDRSGVLKYANCGHVPPLLLRADGQVERLDSTAAMMGVLADWRCPVAETRLAPGDTLLIYSDGASEPRNRANEEFGEERLASCLARVRDLAVAPALAELADGVRRFAGGELTDDLTLVIARSRRPPSAERLRGGGTGRGPGGGRGA